jgi:hypothetical protein
MAIVADSRFVGGGVTWFCFVALACAGFCINHASIASFKARFGINVLETKNAGRKVQDDGILFVRITFPHRLGDKEDVGRCKTMASFSFA